MADHLQLDPVGLEHLPRHLRRQHRFLGGMAARRIGQDEAVEFADHLEKLPALFAACRFTPQRNGQDVGPAGANRIRQNGGRRITRSTQQQS